MLERWMFTKPPNWMLFVVLLHNQPVSTRYTSEIFGQILKNSAGKLAVEAHEIEEFR